MVTPESLRGDWPDRRQFQMANSSQVALPLEQPAHEEAHTIRRSENQPVVILEAIDGRIEKAGSVIGLMSTVGASSTSAPIASSAGRRANPFSVRARDHDPLAKQGK